MLPSLHDLSNSSGITLNERFTNLQISSQNSNNTAFEEENLDNESDNDKNELTQNGVSVQSASYSKNQRTESVFSFENTKNFKRSQSEENFSRDNSSKSGESLKTPKTLRTKRKHLISEHQLGGRVFYCPNKKSTTLQVQNQNKSVDNLTKSESPLNIQNQRGNSVSSSKTDHWRTAGHIANHHKDCQNHRHNCQFSYSSVYNVNQYRYSYFQSPNVYQMPITCPDYYTPNSYKNSNYGWLHSNYAENRNWSNLHRKNKQHRGVKECTEMEIMTKMENGWTKLSKSQSYQQTNEKRKH